MIEINNLKKSFGNYTLFTIDKLSLPSTGLILIKGENGCGKTTFFNMLSLIDNDYIGDILIDGKNYKNEFDKIKSDFRKNNISYIFQKLNFISFLSIESNQNLFYELNDDKTKNDITISDESNSTPIYKLSQGQQEKRRLDSGLNIQKNIYLLDEVLSSLDLKARETYINKIVELSKNSLVLIVSHDVDIEKYADEIYEFKDHKLHCLKNKETVIKEQNKKHNYELKTHKIFFHYSLSIFFIILLNTILSSMLFSLTYTGAFALKDDSYIYLKQAFEKEGYLIFEPQNDVTSNYLINKFNGSCFEASDTSLPLGKIVGEGKENTVYCTTKTFKQYSKAKKEIANKKLISSGMSRSYTIEIDDSLKDGIFFQKYNNSLKDDETTEYLQFYRFAFYDTDNFTKDELQNKYGEVCFVNETLYKKSNTLNYKLEDDTFYVDNYDFLSSKTVTKFITPYYNSKNDQYEQDFNKIFSNGITTKLLDQSDHSLHPVIVVSDNTSKKFNNNNHSSVILIKD